ncbi:solute carrier family 25 (mitochondrial carnitine/acylcarnitine transporter), member 20/29 [Sporothrix schenckii 1099-18]|uniref:Mitochondrial thiamine pyrophosphate carrier 1 n=2 Tax=Sporothrix schenckii TaxID=29908 RepID=U7Q137_SPOS1|nr:solute carrier family 25 (mitochondrial carnitine/acylcarnitine transporter), member 20/29 [Sporothrix schenckii 1099-18]ERT00877.1 hypothetical protein HMPREF1624_02111 [Sporothrix schenckii ATCC 58251]KJR87973.1 solute carrier family 25 (mitochondrial carnitine/acylcarnitine transporter), member 20/29 [Sporothrix schenckii 1099-18]
MSADFWAGYISGAAGILIGNPLDLVKVRLQAGGDARLGPLGGSGAAGPRAASSGAARPSFFQRTAALATGAAAPVLGYGALNALLFVSYRQAETFLIGTPLSPSGELPASPPPQTSAATTWVAGAAAGLATWIVSAPTELIKCRAQLALAGPVPSASSPSASQTPGQAQAAPSKSPSSWSIARQVWRAEGLRGFFLGGSVTALRDSIGYGFYFWSYLLATDAWRRYEQGGRDVDVSASTTPSAAATLMCGGLAGVVTWASVFPLDVVKTRVQAQALLPVAAASPNTIATSTTPLLGSTSTASRQPRRLSTLEITRIAYREGGTSVFFRGLGVCSARAFVVNAVQWAVYEWIMRELGAKVH